MIVNIKGFTDQILQNQNCNVRHLNTNKYQQAIIITENWYFL